MQTAKQISVRLVNKPGKLAHILTALSKEKVNLLALSVMDSGDRSALRFVPDDAALARSALDTINVPYETADVLLADMSDQHGSFQKICERLALEHLNIDYAYSAAPNGRGKNSSLAVIKVNNLSKAQRILSSPPSGMRERVKPVRRRRAVAR